MHLLLRSFGIWSARPTVCRPRFGELLKGRFLCSLCLGRDLTGFVRRCALPCFPLHGRASSVHFPLWDVLGTWRMFGGQLVAGGRGWYAESPSRSGGTGRRNGFKIRRPLKACGFKSLLRHCGTGPDRGAGFRFWTEGAGERACELHCGPLNHSLLSGPVPP